MRLKLGDAYVLYRAVECVSVVRVANDYRVDIHTTSGNVYSRHFPCRQTAEAMVSELFASMAAETEEMDLW